MLILMLVTFLFGLVFGSFVNVIIYRIQNGENPVTGRSKCLNCKKTIKAVDNIPLISYLFLRGKCRNCRKPISWSYPAVEFLTGILFVWWLFAGSLFFKLSQQPFSTLQPIFWLLVGVLFISIFFSDLLFKIIPDVLVILLGISAILYRIILVKSNIMQTSDLVNSIYAAIATTAFFLFLVAVTKGKGMGLGDVKLGFVLGILLGWQRTIVSILISFISGAIVAAILMILGKKKFGQTIAFGPFMICGAVTALLWGFQIWNYYFSMLL